MKPKVHRLILKPREGAIFPSPIPDIFLHESESGGRARCGCGLEIEGPDGGGPAFYFCRKHKANESLVQAVVFTHQKLQALLENKSLGMPHGALIQLNVCRHTLRDALRVALG